MPRNPKRKLGAKPYANYTAENLAKCLEAVRSKKMTQSQASKEFGVPKSTIKYKVKDRHGQKVGRPRVFTDSEENCFVHHLFKLGDYGFPFVEMDFRMAVKYYLDKKGVNEVRFKNNLPGYEWTKSFLKRQTTLSTRISTNIKKVRASIEEKDLVEYIDFLKKELIGVDCCNVYNYDETNLVDDPGSKKVICKRGVKYIETICNSTKSATSIMMCGNAAGELIPPYVVYKSINMWDSWRMGGPPGAKYNRTKSGWFDAITFESWFEEHFLVQIRNKSGPFLLLGDNLSSHISPKVLSLCEEKNIRFVCLPPNTTHISQPLDVAFFAPMKRAWRGILSSWKQSKDSKPYPTIPKELFPTLLKKLMEELEPNTRKNLISGFEKTGVWPCTPEPLLKRLPKYQPIDVELVSDSFLDKLEENRAAFITPLSTKRKKKLNVPPGKAVTAEDILDVNPSNSTPTDSVEASKSRESTPKSRGPSRPARRKIFDESSSTSSIEMVLESEYEEESEEEPNSSQQLPLLPAEKPDVGGYVSVQYEGERYPGVIEAIGPEGPVVSCMEKKVKFWRWPDKKDCQSYKWSEVQAIQPPKAVSKRNQYACPELDLYI